MRKRGLCYHPVSVRLSVCPSDTLVYCIHTAEDIVKLLSRSGKPIILLFFDSVRLYPTPKEPFSGGAKYTGFDFFVIFD